MVPWGYGATRHRPSEMPSGGSCKKLKVSFGCLERLQCRGAFLMHGPSHRVLGERGLHQGGLQPPPQRGEVIGMWH